MEQRDAALARGRRATALGRVAPRPVGNPLKRIGKYRLVPAGRVALHAAVAQYCNLSKRTAVAWGQGTLSMARGVTRFVALGALVAMISAGVSPARLGHAETSTQAPAVRTHSNFAGRDLATYAMVQGLAGHGAAGLSTARPGSKSAGPVIPLPCAEQNAAKSDGEARLDPIRCSLLPPPGETPATPGTPTPPTPTPGNTPGTPTPPTPAPGNTSEHATGWRESRLRLLRARQSVRA